MAVRDGRVRLFVWRHTFARIIASGIRTVDELSVECALKLGQEIIMKRYGKMSFLGI